ncbi:MAG: RidA family protein [Actinomycetota bacterium]|nr:RidA family protein [Actinomycetota bacterium]
MFEAVRPTHFPWFNYSNYTFSLGLRRRGNVWLSGHSASEFDPESRHIVVKGGMAEQSRTAYSKIEAILEATGLTFGDVHRIVEYVTAKGIDDYALAEEVRVATFAQHTPAVCTVVVNRLLRPAALIEVEVTAGPPGESLGGAYATDGVVYLSSLISPDHDDLVSQTRGVLERAAAVLKGTGLDLRNVVKTVDYTTPATLGDYRQTGKVRKELLGPVYPGAAGILLSRLQHPKALVSMDVIASRYEPVAVNPGWERYAKLTYSPAVRAGNVLFMSGQAALDPATEKALFDGDVVAQAEYTYTNVLEVLKAAGAGPGHLAKTIEYITPPALERYRDVAKVRERLLVEPYPASTGALCEALLRPEFQFEVDPLAILE